MKINRAELLTTLEKVRPGLASKEILEQSSSFIFMVNKVITYNDETAISAPITGLDFECAVPGDELVSVLSKIKDEEVSIEIIESELVIKGAKFTARIRVQADIVLPIDTLKPETFTNVPDDFQSVINLCAFSTGGDMSKPVLTCLHINNDVVESCDNYRLTRMTLSKSIDAEFLLPAKAINELKKHKITALSLTDGWCHFKLNDNVQFSCRTYEGEFPSLDRVLEVGETHTIKFPADIDGILERASSALIKADRKIVEIAIKDNKVTVKSASENVRYEETARMRTSDELEFSVNPLFLRQVLEKCNVAELDKGKVKKLKFESPNFVHVIALAL